MKRAARLAWLVVGLVSLVGLTSRTVSAAEEAKNSPTPHEEVGGTISAFDPVRGLVMLNRGGVATGDTPQLEFVVNEETVITKAGLRLAPADLRPSDERVAIQYDPEEGKGKPIARAITIELPVNLKRASGKVEAIDPGQGTLTVKLAGILFSGKPMTFAVDESTLVSHEGQRSYLTNLSPGDEVAIQYAVREDKPVASFIDVRAQGRKPLLEPRGRSLETQRQAPEKPGYAPTRQ